MRLFSLIIFLVIHIGAIAQTKYSVADITIEGLQKTAETYLRQFIKTKKGMLLNKALIEDDIQQLNRRTGIAKTIVQVDTINENQVAITFNIEEQKTLIPQFGLGGIKDNFWWQVGLAEFNLGGKGKTLIGSFLSNDRKPNGQIYFENNWIKGSNWGYSIDLNRTASVEPVYFRNGSADFAYSNTGIGLTGIYNITFKHQLRFGSNFFQERYEKVSSEADPGPALLTQDKLLLKADYNYNNIGYDYFYRTGSDTRLLLQSVFTFGEEAPFLSLTYEYKKFWRPYTTANVALRFRGAIASNSFSPFAPFVLDSRVNIRGVGNRVDRGTAQLILNFEYRQTLFHSAKYACQIVAFADSGTWRSPGGELKDLFDKDQFRQFVGGGIRWINKKVFKSVIRIDYGTDLWNLRQNGIVVGFGQYF